jgi:putative DNA primase/helicase
MNLDIFTTGGPSEWPSEIAPHHRAELESSGISASVAKARGYRTANTKTEIEALGFGSAQRSVPALIVPTWTVDGIQDAPQIKPDNPRMKAGKAVKYETAHGTKIRVNVHPQILRTLREKTIPLFITEGAKKADCAISQGLACLSLSGVWNWRSGAELADWNAIELRDRKVYLAFDSDWHQNPQVRKALIDLGAMLTRRKADVLYILLPSSNGQKVGLDDFFVGGGSVQGLLECATTEAPDPARHNPLDEAKEIICTDLGNAERFAAEHGQDVRWCSTWKQWIIWDGKRWKSDDSGSVQVIYLAGKTVRNIQRDALEISDSDHRKKVLAWGLTSESVVRIKAMVELAKSTPGIAISPDQLDSDRMVINLQNGTLELDTLTLREHRREDLLTKIAKVSYTKTDAPACPTWGKFLSRIHGGDKEKIGYIMKALGYSLIGDNRERCFFFCYGASGANGKSTMLSTVADILGEYSQNTNPETFMDDFGSSKNSASPDVAALKEARFVVTSETASGKKMNEDLVKRITGNTDKISARHLFQGTFEFVPQFTIWMMGNHKPTIRGTDDAIWGRVVMIPFDISIPVEERDKDLARRLEVEHDAIFAWVVEGLRYYWLTGLEKPASLTEVNHEYREEQDVLGEFLRLAITRDSEGDIMSSRLYQVYEKWARASNLGVLSSVKFTLAMKDRGFAMSRRKTGMYFTGLDLTAEGVALVSDSGSQAAWWSKD